MFKYSVEEVAVGAVVASLLYVIIGLALAGLVGRALSRSGRAFLRTKFDGQDGAADAVDRLLVVAFYLLAGGFIALTVPTGASTGTAGQALGLLSGKLGELLLVLGALHVASTVTLARLRGGRSSSMRASAADADIFAGRGSDSSGSAADGTGPTGLTGPRSAKPAAPAAVRPASTARTASAPVTDPHATAARRTAARAAAANAAAHSTLRIPPQAAPPPTSA